MTPWVREGIPLHRWLIWVFVWVVLRLTLASVLRIKFKGQERIPKSGGAMMLANHTTLWDPLMCFWGVNRPPHGIGSEQVFRIPVVGWVLRQLNSVPYAKGAKDGAAVRELVAAFEGGGVIGMFPEGLRSWTGEPLPIKRGTGRLVKSLQAPIIFCRVSTGFLQHPRWAKWPRLVPWRVEYESIPFDPNWSVDDINEVIAEGLKIDPETVEMPKGSWGFRLAEGLPEFLWACPHCLEIEGLEVDPADKNCVACSGCQRRWRLDLRCTMQAESADTSTFSVAAARRLLEQIPSDTALSCEHMEVSRVQRGQLSQEAVAAGKARTTVDGVEVVKDGEVVWSMRFEDMLVVLLQVRNKLQIRVEGANYQLDPQGQSTLRWHHFLGHRTGGRAQ